MEVKMFVTENPANAEAQVNEWLRSNPAKVHHVAQSQSEKNGRFVFVMSIYYTSIDSFVQQGHEISIRNGVAAAV